MRVEMFSNAFWYKKVAKCKMKMKKISPTPKSIIHKKPTIISPSSLYNKPPNINKYKPAKYHNVKIFVIIKKKPNVNNNKLCNNSISFNKTFTQNAPPLYRTNTYE